MREGSRATQHPRVSIHLSLGRCITPLPKNPSDSRKGISEGKAKRRWGNLR